MHKVGDLRMCMLKMNIVTMARFQVELTTQFSKERYLGLEQLLPQDFDIGTVKLSTILAW